MQTNSTQHPPPKLLDQVRDRFRVKHSLFILKRNIYSGSSDLFCFKARPQEMGTVEVEVLLTHLAVDGQVVGFYS